MKKHILRLALLLALAASLCALGAGALAAEEGTVLFSGEGVTVTVVDYTGQGTWGPAFTLLLDNNAGQSMDFSLDLVSVNGVMCAPHWSETVPSVKKAESTVRWFDEDLRAAGINYIDEVQARLTIRPGGERGAAPICSQTVTWSAPAEGREGPAVTEPVFDGDFEPIAVVKGDLAVTAVDYDPEGAILFRAENDTGDDLWLHVTDVAVNGERCEPYWSVPVSAGATAYGWCRWDAVDLTRNDIETISTVDFTLEAVGWDNLMTVSEQTVTLTMPTDGAPAAVSAPEGTPAPKADALAVMGRVKLDRYENPYFGLAFAPDEDWEFLTEEELRSVQSMSAAMLQGTEAEGYMDTIDGGYAMAANSTDGRRNVTVVIQHVEGLSGAADQDSFLDLVLGDVETTEDGGIVLEGMEGADIRRNTVGLAGMQAPGLRIEAGGSALGLGVHQQQVYLVRGDWFMQISFTSLSDGEELTEMAALFVPLDT